MKIAPVSGYAPKNTQSFKANLVVEDSTYDIAKERSSALFRFDDIEKDFRKWLKEDRDYKKGTLIIRKNPAKNPKILPIMWESYSEAAYHVGPGEDPDNYTEIHIWNMPENLEFEYNGKKSGFFFNNNEFRSDKEILGDFKAMFDYLA